MTREDTKNMLVFKEDYIARPGDDDSLQPFKVICADENIFVIGQMVYNKEKDSYITDYNCLEAYSNDKAINTLDDLGFVICDTKG